MTRTIKVTDEVEAEMHIATLRGLYGDLGQTLDDPSECGQLLAQIDTAHDRLEELLRGTPVDVS
jgi:hypothetical protein